MLASANYDDVLPQILPIITDTILAENFDEEFMYVPLCGGGNGMDVNGHDVLHVNGFSYTNKS